uniref:Uncharacterized protein n=1 Tax=Phrynocephalus forsythii TaxID=171643 RepID=A0A9Q1AR05_9SAUR|nr:hypothetical protein JRQ81_011102 [Phrynocephalus forsythii]
MDIDKTRWRELGLTPRQLSKKIGVTYSMAEFITQSYRKQVQTPPAACARPRGRKGAKKNRCADTLACKSGGEETPGFTASCGQKRQRSEPSDSESSSSSCVWCKTREVHETEETPGPSPRTRAGSCKQKCENHSASSCRCSGQKTTQAWCSRRRKHQNSEMKKRTGARSRQTLRCCCDTQPCQKKRKMIPIDIHLDIPLNIFLDDGEGTELGSEALQCKKWKNKSTGTQVPSLDEENIGGHQSERCQRPERSGAPWKEPTEDPHDIEMEDCVSCDDNSSEEQDRCRAQVKTKSSSQLSWWEKIQECMIFLETLLSSLINKC